MPQFNVYDPDQVILAVGGADIEGLAAGNFITVAQDSDAFNMVVGIRGDVARSKTSNKAAKITVRLMQTSPGNDILSTIHNLDQSAPNGAGVFTVGMRDSATGRAFWTGATAWIVKAPDVNMDAQDTPREWVIQVARLERFDGGVG